MPKDANEVGCLWIKVSGKGNPYLSGKIDGIGNVVVFKVKKKTSDKQPDYRILKSTPRENAVPAQLPEPEPDF